MQWEVNSLINQNGEEARIPTFHASEYYPIIILVYKKAHL